MLEYTDGNAIPDGILLVALKLAHRFSSYRKLMSQKAPDIIITKQVEMLEKALNDYDALIEALNDYDALIEQKKNPEVPEELKNYAQDIGKTLADFLENFMDEMGDQSPEEREDWDEEAEDEFFG